RSDQADRRGEGQRLGTGHPAERFDRAVGIPTTADRRLRLSPVLVGSIPRMTGQLEAASSAVDAAARVIGSSGESLARAPEGGGRIPAPKPDRHQVLAYDLAHAASALEGCRVMLDYGGHGELESMLARAFVADVVADLGARLVARDEVWGADSKVLEPA